MVFGRVRVSLAGRGTGRPESPGDGAATGGLTTEGTAIFEKVNQGDETRTPELVADDSLPLFYSLLTVIESAWNSNDRKSAIGLLLTRILAKVSAEECLIYLLNDSGLTLQRAHETGKYKNLDMFDHLENHALIERVLNSGSPLVNNAFIREIKGPFSEESLTVHSILCCPLQHKGEKVGALEVLNKKDGAFGAEDLHFIQMLAEPLAVAFETLRMFDNTERLTITDDLTKLYNYRYLLQYLNAEVKRCLRYKKKVSLLFIDVDGFKRINDTFGHLVGSRALAELGQVLRSIVRETDVIGRYGGDEFVIVLPETPLNGALAIAERIRKRIEDYEFVAQDQRVHLTVSLGVANLPKHTLTAEGLIKKADAAMYRAKELSKNTIRVAV
jgi:diguanylate cyclase (GGDEF)-like protein